MSYIFAHRLNAMYFELFVDVVQMDSVLLCAVTRLAEQGIIFSMAQVEWQQLTGSNFFLMASGFNLHVSQTKHLFPKELNCFSV